MAAVFVNSHRLEVMRIDFAVWSTDQKSVYLGGDDQCGEHLAAWRWDVDGPNPERFVDNSAVLMDADPSGRYLLGVVELGTKDRSLRGVPRVRPEMCRAASRHSNVRRLLLLTMASLSCTQLFPVGKSPFTVRLGSNGKVIGTPQVALKIPFTFPSIYLGGNAYDFSRDLSTIVYARPSRHFNLYLLSQK